jgi:hypothetical protein
MGGRSSEAWALVPEDIKELLKDLPDDQIDHVLSKLVQASAVSYRELTEQDVAVIKVPAACGRRGSDGGGQLQHAEIAMPAGANQLVWAVRLPSQRRRLHLGGAGGGQASALAGGMICAAMWALELCSCAPLWQPLRAQQGPLLQIQPAASSQSVRSTSATARSCPSPSSSPRPPSWAPRWWAGGCALQRRACQHAPALQPSLTADAPATPRRCPPQAEGASERDGVMHDMRQLLVQSGQDPAAQVSEAEAEAEAAALHSPATRAPTLTGPLRATPPPSTSSSGWQHSRCSCCSSCATALPPRCAAGGGPVQPGRGL